MDLTIFTDCLIITEIMTSVEVIPTKKRHRSQKSNYSMLYLYCFHIPQNTNTLPSSLWSAACDVFKVFNTFLFILNYSQHLFYDTYLSSYLKHFNHIRVLGNCFSFLVAWIWEQNILNCIFKCFLLAAYCKLVCSHFLGCINPIL